MISCANATALQLAQRLVAEEPTPALVSAAVDAAEKEVASRLRTDREYWLTVLHGMTCRPGTKFAAALLYPAAMKALRSLADAARNGAYQSVEERAIGLYLVGCEEMAKATAKETAASYLRDGDSHREAVRKAVEWVGSCQ